MDRNKIFLGFVTAVLGLLLLITPEAFIKLFVIILGVAAVIDGIFILAATRNLIIDPQYNLIVIVRGILSILIGAVAVFLPLVIASAIWNFMAYTLAVYLLISSSLQIYTITKLHRNGIMIRQSMIEVISSLILALVLIVIPSNVAGQFIIRLFGIALFCTGIGLIVMQWRNRITVINPDNVQTASAEEAESSESANSEENTTE